MKKVIVLSKTHLDLGFTDLAENIRKKYIDEFIPNAVNMAEKLNGDGKKFVWTTGSWLIMQELKYGTEENRQKLIDALKCGNIVAHALPFTMHTELLDKENYEYGLSYIEEIDNITSHKTISAKVTDVPGHTKAIVPILRKHGIKLLHIGVNGTSSVPKVPECFLWRVGDEEIVVVYSGQYGGAYENEFVDDVLYFDHTLDNHGADSENAILDKLQQIQNEYPDYQVVAGSLDDYADQIWNVRHKLPVLTSEIGDSWIHGSASDPYKSAALRTLISLKNKWLADGSLKKADKEYKDISDYILCLAEHTGGMDVKVALNEYDNYLKSDFEKARVAYSGYEKIEKSWAEQREYITKACEAMSSEHMKEAKCELAKLIPTEHFAQGEETALPNTVFKYGNNEIVINEFGGIGKFVANGKTVIKENNKPCITYDSYGIADYDFFFSTYIRNINETKAWAYADFGKPNIERFVDKYPQGRFNYELENLTLTAGDTPVFTAQLKAKKELSEKLGAPRFIQIRHTLLNDKITVEVLWDKKDASRIPECLMLHFYPQGKEVYFTKLGRKINPFDVVENAGRNLSAVENVAVDDFEFKNYHSPLAFVGEGKILKFDNKFSSLDKGIGFILHDNVWGTNFPLWYSDNAYFKYDIKF